MSIEQNENHYVEPEGDWHQQAAELHRAHRIKTWLHKVADRQKHVKYPQTIQEYDTSKKTQTEKARDREIAQGLNDYHDELETKPESQEIIERYSKIFSFIGESKKSTRRSPRSYLLSKTPKRGLPFSMKWG